MVGSCEPVAASGGDPYRPPKATKNTTGVMLEPSQGVLEASRRVPQRPRAYRMPPGVSQSVLEHPGLPGASWSLLVAADMHGLQRRAGFQRWRDLARFPNESKILKH